MFNSRGMTLVEVLVSVAILAGGSVYVLRSLATSAEVQRTLETRAAFYPIIAQKLAQSEVRIFSEKDPLSASKGLYESGSKKYYWRVENQFLNPADAETKPETWGPSVLLTRSIETGAEPNSGKFFFGIETVVRAPLPENQP